MKLFHGPTIICMAVLAAWVTGTPAAEQIHWSYAGDDGPDNWAELSSDFGMCGNGMNQSPIDISDALDADLPVLDLNYSNPGATDEINNGHTIQVSLNPGNFLTIWDQQYETKQFHFHSPSEHTIGGKSFPLEVHLVHANEAGELAVIGILFEEGDMNPTLDQIKSFRSEDSGSPVTPVDHNGFITSRGEYYSYNGSLTTPPCSEGVRWIVLKNPLTASKEQIDRFHDTLGFDSNRPIQPANARIILE